MKVRRVPENAADPSEPGAHRGEHPAPDTWVTAAGHICLDVIPQFRTASMLEPGSLNEVGPAQFATGGAIANVGLALAKLGVRVRLNGRVGDDPFGSILEGLLRSQPDRLQHALERVDSQSTSYSVVISPPGRDRLFLHHPGCNDTFDPAAVDRRLLSDSRVLYFGYPPAMRGTFQDGGESLARLLLEARDAGVLTVLDMSMPDPLGASGKVDWPRFLDRVLPHVDIFMPSFEETLYMLRGGRKEYDDNDGPWSLLDAMTTELLGLGASVAVVKLGEDGIYLRSGDEPAVAAAAAEHAPKWSRRTLWSPAFRVEVEGTTGAGDATVAGFIAGVLAGLSPEECLATAAAVGACSVEAADASSGVRSWRQTRERMTQGWQRMSQSPPRSDWRLHETSGCFHGPGDGA